jgi:hypothetical protein
MRYWLGCVAVGFALVAVWTLPPSSAPLATRQVRPEFERYEALSRELNGSYEALKRVRWADSLGALVARSAGARPLVLAPPSVDPMRLADLEQAFAEEVGATTSDGRLVLAQVFQPSDHGLDPSVRTNRMGRTETYAGSRDGVDYCMRVVVTSAPVEAVEAQIEALRSGNPWFTAWGACRFFAKHGMAGFDVLLWLKRGGTTYARIGTPRPTGFEVRSRPARRGLFGMSGITFGQPIPVPLDRCLSGSAAVCAGLFLTPADGGHSELRSNVESAERSPALAVGDDTGVLGPEALLLLADLEADFGPEAFGRFWRSDAPVEMAFRDAFGIDVGPWVLSWVDRIYGTVPAGPRLAGSTTTWPLGLTLALFAAIAILFSRRRRVA